jgi:hypothetical protein
VEAGDDARSATREDALVSEMIEALKIKAAPEQPVGTSGRAGVPEGAGGRVGAERQGAGVGDGDEHLVQVLHPGEGLPVGRIIGAVY